MPYKSVAGQLNWVPVVSRPDISFSVCIASTPKTKLDFPN